MGTYEQNATQSERRELSVTAARHGGAYEAWGMDPVRFQVLGFDDLQDCEKVKDIAGGMDAVASVGDCHWYDFS